MLNCLLNVPCGIKSDPNLQFEMASNEYDDENDEDDEDTKPEVLVDSKRPHP